MKSTLVLAFGALALTAVACTQNTEAPAADAAGAEASATPTETRTVVREVPSAPVVVEREVPVPVAPPIVVDRDNRESTTVRAGQNGIEVETTRQP